MSGQPSVKRKLDEVISALDEAIQPSPERPPPPKRTIVSIYATLAKYGITSSLKDTRQKAKRKQKQPVSDISSLPSTSLYRPSSLPCLLARLETYKLSTFGSKPTPIDALACALAGWINEGRERLVCGLCKASWMISSMSGLRFEAVNALVEKQVSALITEHCDGCPWKVKQCDPTLYSIPLSSPSQLIDTILGIANSLDQLLQGVKISHPLSEEQADAFDKVINTYQLKEQKRVARLEAKEKQAEQSSANDRPSSSTANDPLPTEQINEQHQTQPMESPRPSISALLVALMGWEPITAAPISSTSLHRSSSMVSLSRAGSVSRSQAPSRAVTPLPEGGFARSSQLRSASVSSHKEVDGAPNQSLSPEKTLLCCSMCFRRVPLWNFLPSHEQSNTNEPAQPSSSPLRTQKVLDLLKEHRHFCAYVSRNSTLPSFRTPSNNSMIGTSDKLCGWEARLSTALRFGIGDAARLEVYGIRSSSRASSGNDVPGLTKEGAKEVLSYLKKLLG